MTPHYLQLVPTNSRNMETRYGISVKQFTRMLHKQRGACAICSVPFARHRPPCIDHCHDTGKVRGLLCSLCNTGLGCFADNTEIIKQSIIYLRGTSMSMTQPEAVLAYLRKRKSITQATASAVLAVSRLAAVIPRLRAKGLDITTHYVDGVKGRYAVYTLRTTGKRAATA